MDKSTIVVFALILTLLALLIIAVLWVLPDRAEKLENEEFHRLQISQFEVLKSQVLEYLKQSDLNGLTRFISEYYAHGNREKFIFIDSNGRVLVTSPLDESFFQILPRQVVDSELSFSIVTSPDGLGYHHFYQNLGIGSVVLHLGIPVEKRPFFHLAFSAWPYYMAALSIVFAAFVLVLRFRPTENNVTRVIKRESEPVQNGKETGNWKGVLEDIPAGVFIVDSSSHLINYVNQTGAELIGVPKPGIENKRLNDYLHTTDSSDLPMGEITNKPVNNRAFLVTRKDSRLPIALYKRMVEYDHQLQELQVFFDISELRELEDRLRQAFAQKDRLANHDQLTSLYNRRAIIKHAEAELNRALRGEPMSLVMLDIDHFKAVNDNHGHDVGDVVLKQMGTTISSLVRPYDWVGRWGGEEFIILLPGSGLLEAAHVTDRIRLAVEKTSFGNASSEIQITVSLGVASTQKVSADSFVLDSLTKKADQALYHSKENGRNMVSVFENSQTHKFQEKKSSVLSDTEDSKSN